MSEVGEVIQTSADVVEDVENGKLEVKGAAEAADGTAPQPDPNKRAVVSSVLAQLEQLIVSEEWRGGEPAAAPPNGKPQGDAEPKKRKKVSLPKLSELGRSVVTSYSLKAYVALLAPDHRHNIAAWLSSHATQALTQLFHFPDSGAYFHHDEVRGGVVEVLKRALRQRYPDAAAKGYAAFAEKPPVVFVSPALHYDLQAAIASETGVGEVVVAGKMEGPLSEVEGRLDQAALERQLEALGEAKTPVLVVAVVGSAFFGANDLISKLLELRGKAVVSSVLAQLEQLIVSEEWRGGEPAAAPPNGKPQGDAEPKKRKKVSLPKLSELGRSVVTSYSLKAYVALLAPDHRHNIAAWLSSHATQALTQLFHFPDSGAHFHHDEVRGGVVEVLKRALRQRYPDAAAKGYAAFAEKPPVVFVSPALHYDLQAAIASETGVGEVVVAGKMEGPLSEVEGRLDQAALERQLEALGEAKTPVLVVAVVGSAFFGANDLISKLLELRGKYGFWLHVVGAGLAAMGLAEPPTQLRTVLQAVDSLTLPLGQWLGLQAVPAVTLYKKGESGDGPPTSTDYREKLEALPWWIALQHLGPARVSQGLAAAYQMSAAVLSALAKHRQIALLGVPSPTDLAAKVEKGSLLPPTVLLFKYANAHLPPQTLKVPGEGESLTPEEVRALENAEYLDCLNSWLAQGLIAECPQLGLHLAELGVGLGTGLRYSALESVGACATTEADVGSLGKHMGDTLSILDATVEARSRLPGLLAGEDCPLVSLSVMKWAGVGAVAYVPSMVRDGGAGKDPAQWSEKAAQQVAHLNIELVHSLRANDSAFSVGEDRRGMACVKFGMLADQADLEDLVRMVSERGKAIEESAQYMESLAEMIRQGIEAANEDLRKENDDRLIQEGVMRQVPLVGGLLNWLSPLPKETSSIKGRAFDLKTGRIHSTDVLYKHRLQLASAAEGPLTPATPIDTPQTPHGVGAPPEEDGHSTDPAPNGHLHEAE